MAENNNPKQSREVEVQIYSLATTANEAIVFLEESEGIRLLPIWIGPVEGQAIAIKFSGIPLPRPFTHDLMLSLLKTVGYTVEKVVIDNIKESTFYATTYIKGAGGEHAIDSRPSDAIALAVRAGCSIYVTEDVLNAAQTLAKPITEDEVKQFKDQIKDIKPSDIFGTDKNKGPQPPEGENGHPGESNEQK